MSAPMPVLDTSDQATTITTRVVEIGGMAIALQTSSPAFARMVEQRYGGFVIDDSSREMSAKGLRRIVFDIELYESPEGTPEESVIEESAIRDEFSPDAPLLDDLLQGDIPQGDLPDEILPGDTLEVGCQGGVWRMQRGDFLALWDSASGRGQIRQNANPYALDSVLRIVHSLVLAREGEFLVHGASAIRNGRAFLFAGVSGAGKTTISRLAPADATLLTDEISYVRKAGAGYCAHGTPFAGELARLGTKCSAPLQALYLLRQGPENRIDEIHPARATQALMRNILFFARDAELVQRVFEGACEFVERVPVRRLTFRPDAAVWELIG